MTPAPEDGGGPVFADANITPDASGCTTTPPTRGPYPRTCKPATANECDGRSDFAGFANGGTGNGYDDDCDGLVDEGCACPAPGTTKTCFLVSGGQIDPATREPALPRRQVRPWRLRLRRPRAQLVHEGLLVPDGRGDVPDGAVRDRPVPEPAEPPAPHRREPVVPKPGERSPGD